MRLETGEDPLCFEEGSVGWVVDRPTFVLADCGSVSSRMTADMRQEEGAWKRVHARWSVGVSNQKRSLATGPSAKFGATKHTLL